MEQEYVGEMVTAYRCFAIYADYDGGAPDTADVCLVATEEVAKKACEELNKDPRAYTVCFVDGHESMKKWRYRRALTTNPSVCHTTAQAVLEDFRLQNEDDEDWDEDEDWDDDAESE
jgi:hypothetical protein